MDMDSGVLIPNRDRKLRCTNHDDKASSWESYYLWRFLCLPFHYGFLITLGALLITKIYVSVDVWYVSPLVYVPVAIYSNKFLLILYSWIAKVLQVLDRSKYAFNLVAATTHELVVTSTERNQLLQLVISLQACSFIVYLRAVACGDRSGLISLLPIEFSRTASGFFYNGEIFRGICFAIPACIVIVAQVVNKGRRPSVAGVLDQVLDIVGGDLEEIPARRSE